MTVQTEQDVERVISELRSALEEHIRLAKESLTAQASTISVFDANLKETQF